MCGKERSGCAVKNGPDVGNERSGCGVKKDPDVGYFVAVGNLGYMLLIIRSLRKNIVSTLQIVQIALLLTLLRI